MHFDSTDRTKNLDIPILPDILAESTETFTLELVIPQEATNKGVVAQSPATARITIVDDDRKDD